MSLNIFRFVLETWRSLRKKEKVSMVTEIILAASLFTFALIHSFDSTDAERKRLENLSYVAQVESLNNIQQSLNDLNKFVELQREKLKESEDLVNNLKSEEEKLKPVVETNRQVIEAILDLQSKKSRSSVWFERGIGFFSGILASLIATFISRSSFRKKTIEASAPVDNH